MDNFWMKERVKFIFRVIAITLVILGIIWTIVFCLDFLLLKNDNQTLFTITKVDNVEGKYITTQKGLGYKYITKDDKTTLYIFGKEVK